MAGEGKGVLFMPPEQRVAQWLAEQSEQIRFSGGRVLRGGIIVFKVTLQPEKNQAEIRGTAQGKPFSIYAPVQ